MYKLLIVDDEEAICSSLQFALENEYHVITVTSRYKMLEVIAHEEFDIVLLDLRLGESDGLEVLQEIRQLNANAIVIIMTAYGSIQSSVEAMKRGAFYYITKPINRDELKVLLANATENLRLKYKIQYFQNRLAENQEKTGIIGVSPAMAKVFQMIDKVKDINTNVLITGESGTGKELVAKSIHYTGVRKNESFVVVNCAAIPAGLLESELFGHERGAFTGAIQRKTGAFEIAHRGTIFLDEICEMELSLQAKLLRAVQEREICPVGSELKRKLDVRIVCATNRDTKQEIAAGRFREDLFYRLNVINIHVPPLRERIDDIPLLVKHFVDKYNKKFGKHIENVDNAAMKVLYGQDFKGNVRELENIIERAVALSNGSTITAGDMLTEVCLGQIKSLGAKTLIPVYIGEDLATVEKKVILQTLKFTGGNKREAAKVLNISERNLRYKLKEYGCQPAKFAEAENFAGSNI